MRHAHLHFEDVIKQEGGLERLADAFLRKQAIRPEPRWYADLLEEHRAEIAAAVLLWFSEVQDALAAREWFEWTDPFLWIALEERLAALLAPGLRDAARASARRQAVEEGEPIALRQADIEVALWARTEAARQARLIADETRLSVIESMMALGDEGIQDASTFSRLLGAGLFMLNRRFARAALRPILTDATEGIAEAVENARRLLDVRRVMIETSNTVNAVHEGMALAAWFWARDGFTVTKTWWTIPDERRCEVCAPLHGQTVLLGQQFVATGPSGTVAIEKPEAHILCRCFVEYRKRPLGSDILGFEVR